MHWPDPTTILADLGLPAGVSARQLARAHVVALSAWLAEHAPALALGDAAELLAPAFYAYEAALAGEDHAIADRPSCAIVLYDARGAIAGCLILEYELAEHALFRRLAVAAPALARDDVWLDAEERIGRALGAKVVYGFYPLDDRAQCTALERAGRVLCGVLPNADRADIPGLGVRYVPRAIYAKLLIADADLQWPPPEALRPSTAAFMALLFGRGAPALAPPPAPVPPTPAARRDGLADAWPALAPIADQLRLPAGVTMRQLARADLTELIAHLPAWYPEIATTAQRRLLAPAFYADHVALAGEDQRIAARPIHARVFALDHAMIGLSYSICEPKRSTLRAEFIVIDPRHRGLGLVLATLSFKFLLARAIGVDTVLAMSTLREPSRQAAAERSGFRLAGILPAGGIDTSSGTTKHVFEAMYALSLVPPDRSFRPPAAAMTPHVAAVAELVLGRPSSPPPGEPQ